MVNDDGKLRALCSLLAVAVAVSSAILTVQFMVGFGEGATRLILGAIGGILDVTKIIAPFLCLIFWSRKAYFPSVFAAMLTVALCAVSFAASVSSIEANVIKVGDSGRASTIQPEIDLLTSQFNDNSELARQQREIGQVTKASRTMEKSNVILAKISKLNIEKASVWDDSVINKYSTQITILCALLIELVGVLMSAALYYLKPDVKVDAEPKDSGSDELKLMLASLCDRVELLSQKDDLKPIVPQSTALEDSRNDNVDQQIPKAVTKEVRPVISIVERRSTQDSPVELADDKITLNTQIEPLLGNASNGAGNSHIVDDLQIDSVRVACSLSDDLRGEELTSDDDFDGHLVATKLEELPKDDGDLIDYNDLIAKAVLCNYVKPSVRGVIASGITSNREVINIGLLSLFDNGYIEVYGRGYKLTEKGLSQNA